MTRPDLRTAIGVSALAIVPKVMTITEVAEHQGKTTRTIERWIDDGKFPAHRNPGGRGLVRAR
jgi:excisionase family DNA binding protein